MRGPLSIDLQKFGVSRNFGFLPDQYPLRTLPDQYYKPWEVIVKQIHILVKTRTLRQRADRLPVLSTDRLKTEREWQRAYVILSFLTHGYIWGGVVPAEILPASIAVPMLKVSSHLGLPPIATYAGLNLWNFAPIVKGEPLSMENLTSLHTMTGTVDEAWFYLISVAMEARGGEIVPAVMSAMDAVRADNAEVVRDCLLEFGQSIKDIGVLLDRMYEKCDPEVFYHEIRPFLAGTKNMAKAGLPNGVFYDEGNGKGKWQLHSGGSNAQSSLIQFFDVVLGVQHGPTGGGGGGGNNVYLQQMRNYMPGPHRDFLAHMDSVSNIREYVMNSASGPDVMDAYNLAVQRLKEFRDIHIQIVTKYIIIPSRRETPPGPGMNLAIASSNDQSKLKGTGGTDLIPFLKQSRDETKETSIE